MLAEAKLKGKTEEIFNFNGLSVINLSDKK